jgi:hypothetical protein
MHERSIGLRSVYELRVDSKDRPVRYRIPHYQRGFRWDSLQVSQLLDDIYDFTRREDPHPEDFYCLQPLVLKWIDDLTYEVVDGQQRLMTLLLILRHFNHRLTQQYRQKLYELEYETRTDLLNFLAAPTEEWSKSNIDYFHIYEAIKTIEKWFGCREKEVETIKSALLNQTKLIWYELDGAENAVAAFTRLNVGKIPLTDDELIRALFLRRAQARGDDSLGLKIAYEWDLIEKALQRDDFWAFLSNDITRRGNRISYLFDLLFDLVARKDVMAANGRPYATFNYFSERLAVKGADREKLWLAVKQRFMLLEEWFENRHLYHLVGFLIWKRVKPGDLLRLASGKTKKDFRQVLRKWIYHEITGGTSDPAPDSDALKQSISELLEALEYGPQTQKLQAVLLLFNLATVLLNDKSNMRFQFDSFKRQEWNIEHIRSIASECPQEWKRQKEWLEQCHRYLKSINEQTNLQDEITKLLETEKPSQGDDAFQSLYGKLLSYFREADGTDPDHTIGNLTLLDSHTNKSYKNAPFAVKRQRILSLDRDGVFVPLCTRNVFLKCYNARVDNLMFWGQDDKEGYLMAITDALYEFFAGEWIHA